MADNRCSAYSFYVPLGDESLNGFVEAQSNFSMSMRLLLKGFIYNNQDAYPDIATMDLKDLIAATDIAPERLAEIALEAKMRKKEKSGGKAPEPADASEVPEEAEAVAEVVEIPADTVIDIDGEDGIDNSDIEGGSDEAIDLSDDDDAEDDIDGGQIEEEPEAEPEMTPAEKPVEKPVEKPAETKVEAPAEKPAEKPIEKPAEAQAEKPAAKPAEKPVAQPAAKPVEQPKKPVSERAKYNESQDASDEANPDDILSYMGDYQ